jgi:2-dehydropantoate 2-reductase
MKIAVVGPGALGCLIAGFLKLKTDEEVWLLDNCPERAKKISGDGIRIEGISGNHNVKIDATADTKDIGRADLVILCVKSYSTEEACKDIKDIVADHTYVLTLQNGIGNVQILDDYFGADKVIAGVTSHGSTLLGVGHIRHAGKGDTVIGRADGKFSVELKNVANILAKAGFATKTSKDIDSVIWSKLVINVGINALTAITRLNNGKLVSYEEARGLLRSAVQEAARVIKRKRIKLLYDDPIQKVESVARATATNVSSMLQDVLNKKRTEIDFINGAISRHGKATSIPTPVNDMLTALVKTIESDYENLKDR